MNSTDFKQLIEKRQSWYRSTLENDFDFTPILSGLYSDSSHFIYEILQNAEDAKAKTISFNLFANKLEVTHDGEPFNFKDVESITSIGKSTKAEDITAIGKFGVGFKSVYAITQSPTIRSGGFNFTIKNFVVPTINADGECSNDTNILLPFDHQSKTSEQTLTLVKNRLENLGLLTLLFLKHIAKVVWNESGNTGQYERFAETRYKGFDNVRRVRLASSSSSEEYLVFERPITIGEKQLRVEIAYRLLLTEAKKERIVHSTTSKLFVFLPTNEETFLKFLVQGPFRTTPARDNIPFEDEKNTILIQEIANLVGDSLPIVRELGLLDLGFLEILPLKELTITKQQIYKAVSLSVQEKFKSSEPLIPALHNNQCIASKALLARGKDLTQLLDTTDNAQLFKRSEWIDPNVTEARTPDIRDFFITKLGIPEIDFEAFGRNLTADFLKSKDVSWFKEFYKLLKEQKSLWRTGSSWQSAGVVRSKPIIRLEDGNQIAPFDSSGNPQAYLPSSAKRKTHFKTVHKDIVSDMEALGFLNELGLKEPDLYAEISQYVIPKYKEREVVPASGEYFEDLLNLLIGFQEIRSDKKREFIDSLKTLPVILCTKPNASDQILTLPSEAYFSSAELQKYFSGFDDTFFVSSQLYDQFSGIVDQTNLDEFLKELGVDSLPRRIEVQSALSSEEKRTLRGSSGHTRDVYIHDYDIHGLNHFLSNSTKERSILLWSILIMHIQGLGWQAEKFFKAEYSWFYYTQYKEGFDSKFTRQLRDTPWLFDQSDAERISSSIPLSQLSSDYERRSSASQILIQQLKFKPDAQHQLLQQLSEDDRKKFEVLLGLSFNELEQMVSLVREKDGISTTSDETQPEEQGQATDLDDWKPQIEPSEANISKEPFVPSEQKHATPKDYSGNDDNIPSETEETPAESESDKKIPARKIGRWGEEYVLRALSDDYNSEGISENTETGVRITTQDGKIIEIVWLNIKKDRGRGCDLIIRVNDTETVYIEVKSTSENERQLFPITGTQWEFARKLFNEGQGDKYWIYRVFNAGKKDSRIETLQNPIRLWQEGKLFAHPINLEL